jgi:hypothetical protein
MACIRKLALKPLLAVYVANRLYKNENHIILIYLDKLNWAKSSSNSLEKNDNSDIKHNLFVVYG